MLIEGSFRPKLCNDDSFARRPFPHYRTFVTWLSSQWDAMVLCKGKIMHSFAVFILGGVKHCLTNSRLPVIWDAMSWHWHEENNPLKIRVGFWPDKFPSSTARVLIDAVGLCLPRVSEVWRLFAPNLRRWINSFSGSDFKPRLVYKTWYFCYFFTNFDHQF